jgi:hypothetical protein
MAEEQKPGSSDPSNRILRCRKCGKCTDCTSEDLLTYMRDGWPKCCGDVMTLFIEAELPGGAKS